MFTVNPAQMRRLETQAVDRVVPRVAAHLRTRFPAELRRRSISEAKLEAFVREGVSRGQSYGLDQPSEQELFVVATLLLGPRFDLDGSHPWAGQLLTNPRLTGFEKTSVLHDHLVFGAGRAR